MQSKHPESRGVVCSIHCKNRIVKITNIVVGTVPNIKPLGGCSGYIQLTP